MANEIDELQEQLNDGNNPSSNDSTSQNETVVCDNEPTVRQLTDLVADVCSNGTREGSNNRSPESQSNAPIVNSSSNSSPAMHVPTVSTFSFKHFLSSSSSAFTAPSTTVTSLDSSSSTQNSTGARPKVPQSSSVAIDAITGGRVTSTVTSSVSSNADGGDATGGNIGSTRMKRSPRFSSFDSQASLAEYAGTERSDDLSLFSGTCSATGFRLYPMVGSESSGSTSKRNANSATASAQNTGFPSASTIGNDGCSGIGGINDRQQYVPRSYSNYEMPASMSPSPRRRMADTVTNTAAGPSLASSSSSSSVSNRPNRLSLHPTNSSKLKLDLPIDSAAANLPGPSEFPPASAAALPDFVQDHWMDALYLHGMHLNSPRSSPTRDFVTATASAVWGNMGAVGGVGSSASNSNANASGGSLPTAFNNFGGHEEQAIGVPPCGESNTVSASNIPNSNGASKMLPDFLSDGPIIHSSQRLADVAAGLPSNSIGSPEDSSMTSEMSKLRLDVQRLKRELTETRFALAEQTSRCNDLERQLQEETRRRAVTPTAQQVMRLKQQLAELAEETSFLRRENDALREDGAVGGYSDNATSQRSENRYVRPTITRSQQISQALLRAASNAENNLRQLLAGVDNLRQMASDIEDPGIRFDYDGNPDMFSDFVDDFDEFEGFSGGPAL